MSFFFISKPTTHYALILYTIGQVLNLFLALLLSNFGSSSLSTPAADTETNKIAEAFNRFARFKNWIKRNIVNAFKFVRNKLTNQISGDQPPGERTNYISWIWSKGFYPLVFYIPLYINTYYIYRYLIVRYQHIYICICVCAFDINRIYSCICIVVSSLLLPTNSTTQTHTTQVL